MNDNLILVTGKSATGKSMCLRNLDKPEGVMYLNTESNKKLPFPSKFQEFTIVDPYQVYEAFNHAETLPDVHTIVVDSLTFMMDMFESLHVLPATNTMQAWGEYSQFLKNLMGQYVAKSTKNVIFTAHTLDVLNEAEMTKETLVKVKGSLMNNGIESFFSTVISSKKVTTKFLNDGEYASPLLTYNDEENMLEMKYVFQVRLTKETVNERIRSPLGMWEVPESFIDNDLQSVINRLHTYYK